MNLLSIHFASQQLQVLPDRLRLALQQLSIKPRAIIDRVEHYRPEDIERVRSILANTPPAVEIAMQHRAAGIS